jgi:hypothetical protein
VRLRVCKGTVRSTSVRYKFRAICIQIRGRVLELQEEGLPIFLLYLPTARAEPCTMHSLSSGHRKCVATLVCAVGNSQVAKQTKKHGDPTTWAKSPGVSFVISMQRHPSFQSIL